MIGYAISVLSVLVEALLMLLQSWIHRFDLDRLWLPLRTGQQFLRGSPMAISSGIPGTASPVTARRSCLAA